MSQLLDSQLCLSMSSQYALDWKSVVGFFFSQWNGHEGSVWILTGPKPRVLLGLLLCGSHLQMVLIGKDPAAGSGDGVDRGGGGLVSKCRAISESHIPFTSFYCIIINLAHMWPQRATNEIIISLIWQGYKRMQHTIWKFQTFWVPCFFKDCSWHWTPCILNREN